MNKRMQVHISAMAALIIVTLSTLCQAEERATRKECLAKVAEASALIQDVGSDAAYIKMLDVNGPFIWKNAHIFSIDTATGILLAHINGAGFQMRHYTDATGQYPFADILDLLKTRDQGWLTYITDRMGRSVPRLKHMHYRKVPGENIVLCSGYYPVISGEKISIE